MRALIVVALLSATASASTIVELGPAALEAGADRVVDARVLRSEARWNTRHTQIETHAVLAIEQAHKGDAGTVEIVVPGGTIDGRTQLTFGTPAVIDGERARWFLKARGDGSYRVYGWAQGKWPERDGGFVRDPIAAERDRSPRFAVNGMVWPAAEIPVRYLIQSTGSADLAIADVVSAFDAAFATWQAVPTASLAFQNDGMTALGLDSNDDTNVMLFVESGWTFGPEAAAATSLVIFEGMQTADIAVNGENWTWAIGPANSSINQDVLDLQAVLTHEIGHFSGLGHSDRAFDTMYFAWCPWEGQRTLSIDDKLGLTSLYPTSGNECTTTCSSGEICETFPQGTLCAGEPDPVGVACSYDRVECDGFCLFTAADLSSGYCSRFCDTNTDCPLTHHCDAAMSGGSMVKVCFEGAQPPPVVECTDDTACPAGQFCDAAVCTFECRTDDDCDGTCSPRGQCLGEEPGGCCNTSREPPLWLLGLLLLIRRR